MWATQQNSNQRPPNSNDAQAKDRLTDHHDWHINERPIPRYDKENFCSAPFSSPDVLDFAIEED